MGSTPGGTSNEAAPDPRVIASRLNLNVFPRFARGDRDLTVAATGAVGRCRHCFVHDPPNRAGAAAAFGAAAEAAIDLTGRPDGALGRERSDLMVRNNVARTHTHGVAPVQIGLPRE
jgi:hypothetical protein